MILYKGRIEKQVKIYFNAQNQNKLKSCWGKHVLAMLVNGVLLLS